ncbi:MAG: acetate/propionate family kinase [Actinomycetota bacterium]|nr:acetate/propionate family kinase [Actinomycetota bacterium]
MHVVVVNPGSSSLKLHVLDDADEIVASREVPVAGGRSGSDQVEAFLAAHPDVTAAGVRFVHGGPDLSEAVVVDQKVEDRLEAAADLAPLHDLPALDALRAVRRARPDVAVVACFDTAFFARLPAAAATYAVPWRWIQQWGLRRFGFHGMSHASASRRAPRLLGVPAGGLRLVICHLGAGVSLAAVAGGTPVDTTMGFTPLDGLVMATRPGSVDPGLVLWVQRHGGLSVDDVERALYRESGLAGLSGASGDMREVIAAADAGNERAALALGVYLHRLRAGIASMASAMGGFDAVVFTGGVGENSSRVRGDACSGLGFLGLAVDSERNAADDPGDRDIAAAGSGVPILVIRSREDQEIAREVRRLL